MRRPHVLHFLNGLHVTALLTVIAACTSGPPPPPEQDTAGYERRVSAERTQKDAFFRTSESPLLPADRATFQGLSYYPVDAKYRIPAALADERPNPPVVIELQTSIDTRRRMRKAGTLRFRLNNEALTLTAFADVDAQVPVSLFVPFGDTTSGKDTYKGGRYLDLKRTPTGLYDLDFNGAYHPYCVYNSTYECPVPPRENRLTSPILAGERLPAAK